MKRATAEKIRVDQWRIIGFEAPSTLGYVYESKIPDPEDRRDYGLLSEIDDARYT